MHWEYCRWAWESLPNTCCTHEFTKEVPIEFYNEVTIGALLLSSFCMFNIPCFFAMKYFPFLLSPFIFHTEIFLLLVLSLYSSLLEISLSSWFTTFRFSISYKSFGKSMLGSKALVLVTFSFIQNGVANPCTLNGSFMNLGISSQYLLITLKILSKEALGDSCITSLLIWMFNIPHFLIMKDFLFFSPLFSLLLNYLVDLPIIFSFKIIFLQFLWVLFTFKWNLNISIGYYINVARHM